MSDDLWHIPDAPADRRAPKHAPGAIPSLKAELTETELSLLHQRFKIHREIGRGGSGIVFRATDITHANEIALKILHPALASFPEIAETFRIEARLSMKLRHPQIVRVYDLLEIGRLKILTMELIQGQNLRASLNQRQAEFQQDPQAVAEVVLPIASALSYAHQFTVHRDVKPENIGLDPRHGAKIMDFGIARLREATATQLPQTTITQIRAGTPYYTPPEQIHTPQLVDHRADQFSLGVVVYELLTGTPPIGIAPPLALRRPDLPAKLTHSIDKALSPAPGQRFPDMAALAESLDQGLCTAQTPILRTLASRTTRQRLRTVTEMAIIAGFIIGLFSLLRSHFANQSELIDTHWQTLATVEDRINALHQSLTEHSKTERTERTRFENERERHTLGLVPSSSWIQPSNQWFRLNFRTQTATQLGLSTKRINQLNAASQRARRLLVGESIDKAGNRLQQIQAEIDMVETISQLVGALSDARLTAQNNLQALKYIAPPQPTASTGTVDELQVASDALDRGETQAALERFQQIAQRTDLRVSEHFEQLKQAFDQSKAEWDRYYPNLDLEALAFLVDVPELLQESSDYYRAQQPVVAFQRIIKARSTLEKWTEDMRRLHQHAAPSWNQLADKLENTIGMRFSRVGTGYLSIWETRVVDFARYVYEDGRGASDAGTTWRQPGYTISPVFPVVGIAPHTADNFCAWLDKTFPVHDTQSKLPAELPPEYPDINPELSQVYGKEFGIAIVSGDWDSENFDEFYSDPLWSARNIIGPVGQGTPNSQGIFNLNNNAWEWTYDIFQFSPRSISPKPNATFQIVRGGSTGNVTFHEHEPPLPRMDFILHQEIIGFRVYTSALRKRTSR